MKLSENRESQGSYQPNKNQTQTQWKRPRRYLWIVIIGLSAYCLFLALMVAGFWVLAHRPLSGSLADLPALLLAKATADHTAAGDGGILEESLTPLPSPQGFLFPTAEAAIPTPTPDPSQQTICGGPPLMFIQVAGIDRYNLADAIRIVRADFANQQISVLAIQRATYVSIPHLEEYGITIGLVNSAHSYGEYFYGKGAGMPLLAETIAQNFGIRTDRHINVNYNSFTSAVDAVGGVELTLQEDYYDAGTGKYYAAGTHHLDGETALEFVRMRYSDTDWKRIDRQTDLMMSILRQMTDVSMLPKLPELVAQTKDDFTTDLSLAEINQLVCLVTNVPSESVKFYEIGLDMVTPTVLDDKAHSQVMIPDFELIRPYVEQFINGSLP
jgi:LCP family protein required for cell wall assembly